MAERGRACLGPWCWLLGRGPCWMRGPVLRLGLWRSMLRRGPPGQQCTGSMSRWAARGAWFGVRAERPGAAEGRVWYLSCNQGCGPWGLPYGAVCCWVWTIAGCRARYNGGGLGAEGARKGLCMGCGMNGCNRHGVRCVRHVVRWGLACAPHSRNTCCADVTWLNQRHVGVARTSSSMWRARHAYRIGPCQRLLPHAYGDAYVKWGDAKTRGNRVP